MSEWKELPWALILQALNGDNRAFKQVYDCYDDRVRYAVISTLRRWPEQTRRWPDVKQGVWGCLMARDWKKLRSYDPTRGVPFGHFLCMVSSLLASSLASRYHKAILSRAEVFEVDDQEWDCVIDLILRKDQLEKLRHLAHLHLGPKDIHLYIGYYVEGRKIKDIGAEMGWTENNSFVRKRRLDEKLHRLARDLVAERPGDDPASRMTPPPALMVVAMLVSLWLDVGP